MSTHLKCTFTKTMVLIVLICLCATESKQTNKRSNGTETLIWPLHSDVVHIPYILTRALVLLRRPNLEIALDFGVT